MSTDRPERLELQLPAALAAELRETAARNDRPVAREVRRALTDYLMTQRPADEPGAATTSAGGAAGHAQAYS